MPRTTHRITIHCGAAALFAVLMDPAANRQWQTGIIDSWASCGGPATVGTIITEVRKIGGYRATLTYRLVELDWPRRAAVEIIDGPLRGTASYVCRPTTRGTDFTAVADVALQGRWRCASPMMARLAAAELALSCQRLKTLMESAPQRAVAVTAAQRS
jgi:hypothetical protein